MAEKNLRTAIWAIVIIIVVSSIGALVFVSVWIPPREGGEGVKIAVLDSGIDMTARIAGYKVSRELQGSIITTKSFVTTEFGYANNASIVDDTPYHHGTLVALQIASRSFGIAPQAKLIIARCADSEGSATYPAIYAAIYWAAYEADADIINLSIGGPIISNNTIVELINRIAFEKGVLTVVSAGNSGDETGYALSTIDSPGDALQAITVGASTVEGVAAYSSIGPLKDHRIKPDLLDSGFTLIAIGTSFSAPKVSGKAAVLLSWCRAQGYKTSPGLLKAALMQSASFDYPYPPYSMGAGIADVEVAKTIITQAPKSNGWPLVSFIFPDKLPFSMPTAFQGDIWHFPITIISPLQQTFTFTTNTLGDSLVQTPNSVLINQSGVVDCLFNISSNFPLGVHEESIIVESSLGESFAIDVSINIAPPKVRVGFDIFHSAWSIDHLFGQFLEFRLKLADEGITFVELTHPDNFTHLENFDALVIADPNTFGLAMRTDQELVNYYIPFTNQTITNIVNFVESGHGLFVLGAWSGTAALNETNRLTKNFNITFTNDSIPSQIIYDEETDSYNVVLITDMDSTHPVTADLINFDFLGAKLALSGNNSKGIAWYQTSTNIAVAAYESATNSSGRVIVSGSNFMADNWGVNGKYSSTNNLDFLVNVFEWLTNTTIEQTMPPSSASALFPHQAINKISVSFSSGIPTIQLYPHLSLQTVNCLPVTHQPKLSFETIAIKNEKRK